MAADFSVQFRIDREGGSYSLRLTDTSSFIIDALVGLFKVTYPNGMVEENTDGGSPDISTEGGVVDYPLKFNNEDAVLIGSYTIRYTVVNDNDISFVEKTFMFDWIEPEVTIRNDSDSVIPEVIFTDSTDYDHGSFSEVIDDRVFDCDFPSTSEVDPLNISVIGTELDMVTSDNYYEGVYNPTLDVEVTYTSNTYAYLSVKYFQLITTQYIVYRVPTHIELITYIKEFKIAYNLYKGVNSHQFNIQDEEFNDIIALYVCLIDAVDLKVADQTEAILTELLDRLNIDRTGYAFQATPILPFVVFAPDPTRENTDITIEEPGVYIFYGSVPRTWTIVDGIKGEIIICTEATATLSITITTTSNFLGRLRAGAPRLQFVWNTIDRYVY